MTNVYVFEIFLISEPPPALAKPGLPPPPLPPRISDIFLAISIALIFNKRSSVTPTTIEIFFYIHQIKLLPHFLFLFLIYLKGLVNRWAENPK